MGSRRPGREQALLVLAHLSKGETTPRSAGGFVVGADVCAPVRPRGRRRPRRGGTDSRPGGRPGLPQGVREHSTAPLLAIDRVGMVLGHDRAFNSGKHKRRRFNVPVIWLIRSGRLVRTSPGSARRPPRHGPRLGSLSWFAPSAATSGAATSGAVRSRRSSSTTRHRHLARVRPPERLPALQRRSHPATRNRPPLSSAAPTTAGDGTPTGVQDREQIPAGRGQVRGRGQGEVEGVRARHRGPAGRPAAAPGRWSASSRRGGSGAALAHRCGVGHRQRPAWWPCPTSCCAGVTDGRGPANRYGGQKTSTRISSVLR